MERIMGVLDIKLSKEEENVLLDALDIVKNLDTEIHEIKEKDITTDHLNLISCMDMLTCILERFGSDVAKTKTHEIMLDTTQDSIETSANPFDKVEEDISTKQMLDTFEENAENTVEDTDLSEGMIEETSEDLTSDEVNENVNEDNIPFDEKKEETMKKEIVFPQTYEELVKQFETNEGCVAFARWAESKGTKDLYFANDADGILLRNSSKQDGIGNDANYVCLKFADMIGTGIYDDHSYQFIVFTYSQAKGTSYEAYENIEYAIRGYKTALMEFCKKKFEAKLDKCIASYNNVVAFANSATAEEMAGYYMATFPKERWNAFWEERNGNMSKRDRKTEKILKGLMD